MMFDTSLAIMFILCYFVRGSTIISSYHDVYFFHYYFLDMVIHCRYLFSRQKGKKNDNVILARCR